MYNNLFSNIPIKKRIGKPRESGLTVIIDRGLGLQAEKDLLDLAASYIDLVNRVKPFDQVTEAGVVLPLKR